VILTFLDLRRRAPNHGRDINKERVDYPLNFRKRKNYLHETSNLGTCHPSNVEKTLRKRKLEDEGKLI